MAKIIIFLFIGEGADGKSTTVSLTVQFTGILEDPGAAVIDLDEKRGSSKLDSRILCMPLRSREDFRRIEDLFTDKNRFILDTPGTSKVFTLDAIDDPATFARYGVQFVPVLLVGARGSSMEEADSWLIQMQNLPKIYVISNFKKKTTAAEKEEFEKKIQSMPGPTDKVILHLPPLNADIAKELERLGCPLDDIIQGKLTSNESMLLTRYSTMIDVSNWKSATDVALMPLYDAVRAAGPVKTAEPVKKVDSSK